MIRISPSILSADFSALGDECRDVLRGGADWIHFDVMDGVFVPNLTIGLPVLKSLAGSVEAFYDVHLMIRDPGAYAEAFAAAGAGMITFHVEAEGDPDQILDRIHSCGARAGVVLKPGTPAEAAFPYLAKCDMVLVMTVEPGFGGQKYMNCMCDKIRAVRTFADRIGREDLIVQVDGGIDPVTVASAAAAGADCFVAGSSVFGKKDREAAIRAIREKAQACYRKETK